MVCGDQVPAAGLEDEAVRLQAPVHVGGFLPAPVPDVEHPAAPHRLRDLRQVWNVVVLRVPAGGVEVEPGPHPVRLGAQFGRERRAQFELGAREGRAEAEFGGGARDAGEEERLGLAGAQAGQSGAVAVEQLVAAAVPGVRVERYARRVQ